MFTGCILANGLANALFLPASMQFSARFGTSWLRVCGVLGLLQLLLQKLIPFFVFAGFTDFAYHVPYCLLF